MSWNRFKKARNHRNVAAADCRLYISVVCLYAVFKQEVQDSELFALNSIADGGVQGHAWLWILITDSYKLRKSVSFISRRDSLVKLRMRWLAHAE